MSESNIQAIFDPPTSTTDPAQDAHCVRSERGRREDRAVCAGLRLQDPEHAGQGGHHRRGHAAPLRGQAAGRQRTRQSPRYVNAIWIF